MWTKTSLNSSFNSRSLSSQPSCWYLSFIKHIHILARILWPLTPLTSLSYKLWLQQFKRIVHGFWTAYPTKKCYSNECYLKKKVNASSWSSVSIFWTENKNQSRVFPKDVMRLCRELKLSRTWQDKFFITLTRNESPAQRTPAGLYHGSSAQCWNGRGRRFLDSNEQWGFSTYCACLDRNFDLTRVEKWIIQPKHILWLSSVIV